ncbi:RAVE subunit 2/Rogdi [Lipomyces oligophaga]|uniref:RAVE subunit 2/Rogdi n=1 Tax=Lipomyces oligophaga TaxID=45792 RepID=UPI0034D01D65
MTTSVYPHQNASSALNEEHKVSILELAWLLQDLSSIMASISDGLDECLTLLHDDQPSSTLVLSSNRSEALKGIVVRKGKEITKAEINLKLSSLNKGQVYNMVLSPGKTIPLAQLGDCSNFLRLCLRVVQDMDFVEPAVVLSQLRKLIANIRHAHVSIRNVSAAFQFPYVTIESDVFTPEIPENVAIDLIISESGIIADIRTLQATEPPQVSSSASSIRSVQSRYSFSASAGVGGSTRSVASVANLANPRGSINPRSSRMPSITSVTSVASAASVFPGNELTRTNTNTSTTSNAPSIASSTISTSSTSSWLSGILGRRKQVDPSNLFVFRGQYVKTVERITVQSLDPGLMALISKLNVLELNVGQALRKLEIAMNWK